MVLSPRAHNVLSYSVAWLVLPAATLAFAMGETQQQIETMVPALMLPLALWCVHFGRRASEAMFVHRYSKATFPWTDAGIEYVYYWGFGVWNAYALVAKARAGAAMDALSLVGVLVFVLAELGNARSHWLLREIRKDSPRFRAIPKGFLFEWVSSPHYLFEILSWVGFALVVKTFAAYAFLGVGAAILATWATLRHQAYRKDFDGAAGRALYPERRRALIPFVY